jgi:hypothetical protein
VASALKAIADTVRRSEHESLFLRPFQLPVRYVSQHDSLFPRSFRLPVRYVGQNTRACSHVRSNCRYGTSVNTRAGFHARSHGRYGTSVNTRACFHVRSNCWYDTSVRTPELVSTSVPIAGTSVKTRELVSTFVPIAGTVRRLEHESLFPRSFQLPVRYFGQNTRACSHVRSNCRYGTSVRTRELVPTFVPIAGTVCRSEHESLFPCSFQLPVRYVGQNTRACSHVRFNS